ncbi:MAG: acyl-CoA thioesterase II [Rhodobiaceae bacterium]|nr:acyl-CoA thioesterase II [Rhodobiaceae bacterium]MCC0012560.1 acyl-CoA thioesterase II [Rhodobiaceae bacterium]MCC0050701.1 acyl-CoA thioesterase II [Rhodobiaceae bacterium]MCC0061767.1 acyl-CoA thioesterase II [Rhodobiaceae bacterium]
MSSIDSLIAMLDLEYIEENLFRGHSTIAGWKRVFGGQVIGQALVAAARTVEERQAHSLHGYFLLPGDPSVPIVYEVDRIRDGKSFTTRRVVAIQHGQAIFSMGVSFQREEAGLEHQFAMPDVPPPEELPSEAELKERFFESAPEPVRRFWERERPIELRPTSLAHYMPRKPSEPVRHAWIRANGALPDDQALHRCVLAYASDTLILDTALLAHGRSVFDADIQGASLDHAMWFHHPFRADEWLLYSQDSPSSSSARGFNRGSIFTRDGLLVASVAQEGLIRLHGNAAS